MAEGLLRHYGKDKFRSFSAGSFPTGKVHPQSLSTLERHGIGAIGYESKSCDAFKDVAIDLVITVCDNAAGETCPIFPGNPLKAHWGVPDPAHFQGNAAEIQAEFDRVFDILKERITALVALPFDSMDQPSLSKKLSEIASNK